MKVISLLQPWASLIVLGAKQFETRSWKTSYRGRILIHASKGKTGMRFTSKEPFLGRIGGLRGWYDLPFGAIIGEATITKIFTTEEILRTIHGTEEHYFGDYSPGRYAWQLTDIIKYPTPTPAKSALSIWEFPAENLIR